MQPRRGLIGSLKGEKILLATPFLKWYLEHGLEVTKVHQVVPESTPDSCFKPFGDAVLDARRDGDADSRKAIISDTMKLAGNSGYGNTISNQMKHSNVEYCSDAEASRKVNTLFSRNWTTSLQTHMK